MEILQHHKSFRPHGCCQLPFGECLRHLTFALSLSSAVAALALLGCAHDDPEPISPSEKILQTDSVETPSTTPPAKETELVTPEREMLLAQQKISHLLTRLNSAKGLAGFRGIGPFDLNGLLAFDEATQLYSQKNWADVIRLLNYYLNKSQMTDPTKYLNAQWMLASSYEQSRDTAAILKSIKAYLRFIQYFIQTNQTSFERLTAAVSATLRLMANHDIDSDSVALVISGLSMMSLPDKVLEEISPLVAYAATRQGSHQAMHTITTALEERYGGKPPEKLTYKLTYIRAIGLISSQNWPLATEFLEYLAQDTVPSEFRDHAYLLLGRIYANQTKWASALRAFQKIPRESRHYKDAAFESVTAHVNLSQMDQALNLASQCIAKWPDDKKIYQLKLNMAYLDLRAEQFEQATATIESLNKRLEKLRGFVFTNISPAAQFMPATLKELSELSNGLLPKQSTIEESLALYSKIAGIRHDIFEQRNQIKDLYYSLSETKPNLINSELGNRILQLASIGDELLKIAIQMVGAEFELLGPQAKPSERQKLKFLREKTYLLVNRSRQTAKKIKHQGPHVENLALIAETNQLKTVLFTLEAELKGLYVYAFKNKAVAHQNQVKSVSNRIKQIKDQLAKNMDQIRKIQLTQLMEANDIPSVERLMVEHVLIIHDQIDVLDQIRLAVKDPTMINAQEQRSKAWSQWKNLAKIYFVHLKDLKQEAADQLKLTLNHLSKIENDLTNADAEALSAFAKVQQNLRINAAALADSLTASINAKVAKHQRWLAEIDWMKYASEKSNMTGLSEKSALERQILQDQLSANALNISSFY